MVHWMVLDDPNPAVAYSGGWSRVEGSTRQWYGGVHATSQSGATMRFRFRGTGIQIWGTIPSGSGVVKSQYSIDGGPAITVERPTAANAEYGHLFFQQTGLSAAEHIITVTNAGGSAAFHFDKLEWQTIDRDPISEQTLAAPPPAAAPQPTTQAPVTTQQPAPTVTTPAPVANPPPSNNNNNNNDNNNGGDGDGNGEPVINTPTPTTPVVSDTTTTPPTESSSETTPRVGSALGLQSDLDASGSTTTQGFIGTIPTGLAEGSHTLTGTNGDSGTLVVKVSDGVTQTITEIGPAGTGIRPVGASHAGISKGALAGISAASVAVLMIFLLLAFLLVKRYRSRRAILLAADISDADLKFTQAPPQTRERRNNILSPFDTAAQRTSAMFAGIGRNKFTDPDRAPFTRLRDSVHKPPIFEPVTLPVGNREIAPVSPSDVSSQSAYSFHTTHLPADSRYLFQGAMESAAAGPSTVHRRRNTSDSTTLGEWNGASRGAEVPPPSYQDHVSHYESASDRSSGGESTFVTSPNAPQAF